jgi:protein TonB
MAACVDIKNEYTKFLYLGIVIAAALHIMAFALWPKYEPSVYRLRVVIPKIVDVEDYDFRIPPKPQEVQRPQVPVEIQPSDDIDSDETIAPSIFNPRERFVAPPPMPEQPRWFSAFETPPELIRSVTPRYPDLARKAEVEGTVVVLVTIDEGGRVIDAWIGQSDVEILNDAAIEAAYGFEFEPALQRDIPVKATIRLTFEFRLTD